MSRCFAVWRGRGIGAWQKDAFHKFHNRPHWSSASTDDYGDWLGGIRRPGRPGHDTLPLLGVAGPGRTPACFHRGDQVGQERSMYKGVGMDICQPFLSFFGSHMNMGIEYACFLLLGSCLPYCVTLLPKRKLVPCFFACIHISDGTMSTVVAP